MKQHQLIRRWKMLGFGPPTKTKAKTNMQLEKQELFYAFVKPS